MKSVVRRPRANHSRIGREDNPAPMRPRSRRRRSHQCNEAKSPTDRTRSSREWRRCDYGPARRKDRQLPVTAWGAVPTGLRAQGQIGRRLAAHQDDHLSAKSGPASTAGSAEPLLRAEQAFCGARCATQFLRGAVVRLDVAMRRAADDHALRVRIDRAHCGAVGEEHPQADAASAPVSTAPRSPPSARDGELVEKERHGRARRHRLLAGGASRWSARRSSATRRHSGRGRRG